MFEKWIGSQLRRPRGFLSRWISRYMERGNYEINDWTINLMKIKGEEKILEIGIGNGFTLNKISQRNIDGKNIGIDISKDMVKEAKRNNESFINNGIVGIQEAGVELLSFEDEYFDKVFTVHTIYFWKDIDQGIHEVYRVLKPGGRFYVSLTDKSTMRKMKRTSNFHLFDATEVESRLKENKFKEIIIHNQKSNYCFEAKK